MDLTDEQWKALELLIGEMPRAQLASNHEQHSHWRQIKPLHKRIFAHHSCQFGTGKDKHIEDASSSCSSCNPCERGLFCSSMEL